LSNKSCVGQRKRWTGFGSSFKSSRSTTSRLRINWIKDCWNLKRTGPLPGIRIVIISWQVIRRGTRRRIKRTNKKRSLEKRWKTRMMVRIVIFEKN